MIINKDVQSIVCLGASVSDLDDDQFDPLDPHSALAQISLEVFAINPQIQFY